VQRQQVVHLADPGSGRVRRKPAGEGGGEALPGGRAQLGFPLGEPGDDPELRVRELGKRSQRPARIPPLPSARHMELGGSVARHHRPGNQVAQPLPPRVKGDQKPTDQVGGRQEVGDPHEIARHRGAERHGVARVAHHPDPDGALSRRLPLTEPLE
jgi:hypothetical protein